MWSVFAGICVALFVLCRLQMTAPAEAYSAIHSAGFRYIPVILGLCGILFARRLLGWKSRIISALTLTLLMAVLCGAAIVSAGLINDFLRLTGWNSAVFVHLSGTDMPMLHPYLLSALAGLLASVYIFSALSIIRRRTSRLAE